MRKIRKLLTPADADVQTCLVEIEEHCAKLTSKLSKEAKRAEQERARAEHELALRKEQTKRARDEAKRADREANRAKAAETKAKDRRKAVDAWRKRAERARDKADKLAVCHKGGGSRPQGERLWLHSDATLCHGWNSNHNRAAARRTSFHATSHRGP